MKVEIRIEKDDGQVVSIERNADFFKAHGVKEGLRLLFQSCLAQILDPGKMTVHILDRFENPNG